MKLDTPEPDQNGSSFAMLEHGLCGGALPARLWMIRREVRPTDAMAVRQILASSQFFSKDEVDVAVEMLHDHLNLGERSEYRYLFAEANFQVVGFACYGPIACTVGSFDLYWIAVRQDYRGKGLGRTLMQRTETAIAGEAGRRIYAETSARALYQPTRDFYERCGYEVDATLDDFYSPGDHKVIYVKAIERESENQPSIEVIKR